MSEDNLHGLILGCLRHGAKYGGWFTSPELQHYVKHVTGRLYSDSTITARIRDLRKPQYGGHVIDARKRKSSRSYEYRLGEAGQMELIA